LPDQILDELIEEPYALTQKDARSLMSLDDGERVDYYRDIVDKFDKSPCSSNTNSKHTGRLVGNWYAPSVASPPISNCHLFLLFFSLFSKKRFKGGAC